MIFLSALLFLICLSILPWWSVWLASFALGVFLPSGWKRTLNVALAAAACHMAVAFVKDGGSHGLISARISQLFQLPNSYYLFGIMGALGFILAVVGHRTGVETRNQINGIGT